VVFVGAVGFVLVLPGGGARGGLGGGAGAQGLAPGARARAARDEGVDVRRRGGDEERGELVAADPARDVRLPQRSREGRGEGAKEPVALLVPLAVVRLLEAVEVEEDESEASAVASRPRGLHGELRVEGAMVEEPGERVPAGGVRQLGRDASDVTGDAAVDRLARPVLAVTLQHAAEDEQLGDDLGRREPQALPFPREVAGGLIGALLLCERGDEGRQRAQLTEAPEPVERGHGARRERLLQALDGEIPCGQPHDPVHEPQSTQSVG
jgi:hypothetical protein